MILGREIIPRGSGETPSHPPVKPDKRCVGPADLDPAARLALPSPDLDSDEQRIKKCQDNAGVQVIATHGHTCRCTCENMGATGKFLVCGACRHEDKDEATDCDHPIHGH